MAKWGFIGAALGMIAGVAAAPFTGGASLGLLAAGGALAGSTLGTQIDSAKSSKKANRIAESQLNDSREAQKLLRAEKSKVDDQVRRERVKVEAGIVRGLRRKYKSSEGFLSSSNSNMSENLG